MPANQAIKGQLSGIGLEIKNAHNRSVSFFRKIRKILHGIDEPVPNGPGEGLPVCTELPAAAYR